MKPKERKGLFMETKKKKVTFELSIRQYEAVAKEAGALGLTVGVFSKVVVLEKMRNRDAAAAVRAVLSEFTEEMARLAQIEGGPEGPKKLE